MAAALMTIQMRYQIFFEESSQCTNWLDKREEYTVYEHCLQIMIPDQGHNKSHRDGRLYRLKAWFVY